MVITIVKEENEVNRIGYYAVIPSTILYNKELSSTVKLLYAIITSLSNKDGYCYASNKYLAEKLNVEPVTISRGVKVLRENNYVFVDILRNEKKEIICRKIYPNDVPYRLNNQYPYIQKSQYPYTHKCQEGIDLNVKENNINNNNINTHTVVKKCFAEKVYLYDYEYDNLLSEYGELKTKRCIEELSLYKKSKGIDYESDYSAIKRWVIIRVEELDCRKEKSKNSKKKSCSNYEQREYTAEFLEELYENNLFKKEKEIEDEMEM